MVVNYNLTGKNTNTKLHIVILWDFFSVSALIYRYTVPMGIFSYVISCVCVFAWKHVHSQFRVRLNHGTIYIPVIRIFYTVFIQRKIVQCAITENLFITHAHSLTLPHYILLVTKSVDATLDFCSKMIHIIFTRHSTQHRIW